MDAQGVVRSLRHEDGAASDVHDSAIGDARLMTTKELMNYARGLAPWLRLAAATTQALPAQVATPCRDLSPEGPYAPENATELPICPFPDFSARGRRVDGPYDICPPDMAPSTSYSAAAKAPSVRSAGTASKAVPGLPPGVVLLKGYLQLDEQIKIVQQIRELGIGHGGFYVPSYNTGGRLALRMMCLGLHWEPRTSKYEKTRSSYDGATPPPIPPWLVDVCDRCLGAASAAAVAAGGSRFPALRPDICLANFYERSGRLGMHQDKDEMPGSLRAGLPVVSLSVGDSADFLYGKTREVEDAGSVRLESGDVLVFGGPGRMIFHSVAKVYPNTAPPELIRATGIRPGRLNLTFRQYQAAGE